MTFKFETARRYMALARKDKEIAQWEERNSQIATTGSVLQRAKAKSIRQAFYATGIPKVAILR